MTHPGGTAETGVPRQGRFRWIGRIGFVVILALFGVAAFMIGDVAVYTLRSDAAPADAAIILGAAAYDERPSPVFAERIRHGIALYQQGRVRLLLMTGGRSPEDTHAEAEVARDTALKAGIPADAIRIETVSRTTEENLQALLPIIRAEGIHRVLLVSDPPHMRRAVALARRLGLDAHPSPTPTSRYQSWWTWSGFVVAEAYYLARCRVQGRC